MKAVILAAGLGTRMQLLIRNLPKVMLPILGKPLLEQQILYLRQYRIEEIYINLFYKSEVVLKYFKARRFIKDNLKFFVEERLSGTGGALLHFKKGLNETTLVLFGDVYSRVDIFKMLQFHKNKQAMVTAFVHLTDHPTDSDLVKLNKDDSISALYFKPHKQLPRTEFSLAGVYIFEQDMFDYLPQKQPFDLVRDFLPILQKKDLPLYGYYSDEFIKDIGTPKRYREVLDIIKDV